MSLSLVQILECIKAPVDHRIVAAREMNRKLMLHVEGVGLQEFLTQLNECENEGQFNARKKYATSNKFVTEELLRPTDNAFNARGGSWDYRFTVADEKTEIEFTERLSKIKNANSLRWYIENEWFNKFITDPNGLIVIESDGEETDPKEREAYPVYKSIQSIKAYEQNGVFVDWVVFESHEVKKGKETLSNNIEIKKYWAADEKYWYLISYSDGNILIENVIEHGFDKVPAILCSDIADNVTGWKKSPIDAQIELLDKLCNENSVLGIVEFFHNYPQQFMFADECKTCGGTGNVGTRDEWKQCPNPACSAGKLTKKDVTDIIYMRTPTKESPQLKEPGGYMTMPTEAWELMDKAGAKTKNSIFYSHWNTSVAAKQVDNNDYSSATGRFIDAQPINNRLNKYSKSIEQAHTCLANFIGKYLYPLTFDKAFIQYGRRYLIETPDQIWEKYQTARKQGAPVTTLDILLYQYMESEYRENESMYMAKIKLIKLEPFVHWDIEKVRASVTISPEDKQRKEFFGEWIQTKKTEEILATELEVLRADLDKYVLTKTLNKNEEIKQEVI